MEQSLPISLDAVRAKIEADNVVLRARFLKEIPCCSESELADKAGTGNDLIDRWKSDRMIFSVPDAETEVYPAFQFRDGMPIPVIADMLRTLPERSSPWQIALWFVSSNAWLDGQAPYTMLHEQTAVLQAAEMDARPVIG